LREICLAYEKYKYDIAATREGDLLLKGIEMDHDDAATVAASLSEISEAILRLATEIRDKDIHATVIIEKPRAESEPQPRPEIQVKELTAAEVTKVLDEKQVDEKPLEQSHSRVQPRAQVQTTPPIPAGVRACRVESQIRMREADGQYWIVSVRSYSDGQLREDRKLYRT
jgi:hypothetical protein